MRPPVRTVAPPRPPRHYAPRQQAVLAPMSAKYRSSGSTGKTRAWSPSVKGPLPSTIAETSRPRHPSTSRVSPFPARDREGHPGQPPVRVHPPVECLRALSTVRSAIPGPPPTSRSLFDKTTHVITRRAGGRPASQSTPRPPRAYIDHGARSGNLPAPHRGDATHRAWIPVCLAGLRPQPSS
jgi:hypothetical protein